MVLAKLKARSLLFYRRADCTKYTYDDEGNLVTKVSVGGPTVTWTYDYDVNNRLTSIIETGGGTELYRTTYTYDVFNRRIKEVEDADGAGSGSTAVETRFSYDRNRIWADLDNTNALKVRYVRDEEDGGLFARVKANGDAAWYSRDVWGSTRQMVDNTGALKDTILYDSFGNIQSETDAAFGDRWKWNGRELNQNAVLYYDNNGHYAPESATLFRDDRKRRKPKPGHHFEQADDTTKPPGMNGYPKTTIEVPNGPNELPYLNPNSGIEDPDYWYEWNDGVRDGACMYVNWWTWKKIKPLNDYVQGVKNVNRGLYSTADWWAGLGASAGQLALVLVLLPWGGFGIRMLPPRMGGGIHFAWNNGTSAWHAARLVNSNGIWIEKVVTSWTPYFWIAIPVINRSNMAPNGSPITNCLDSALRGIMRGWIK